MCFNQFVKVIQITVKKNPIFFFIKVIQIMNNNMLTFKLKNPIIPITPSNLTDRYLRSLSIFENLAETSIIARSAPTV